MRSTPHSTSRVGGRRETNNIVATVLQAATTAACKSGGAGGCLFNLTRDPAERVDLAAANPELVADLSARLAAYAATAFQKDRGDVDPAGCYQAIENGNFWGPWVRD